MSDLLDEAIKRARQLSPRAQDALAAIILEEIADEALWAQKFAQHPEVLEAFANEAEREFAAGRTKPLEFPRRK